jgi:hypothetical protein
MPKEVLDQRLARMRRLDRTLTMTNISVAFSGAIFEGPSP